jgi:hypothetical protein
MRHFLLVLALVFTGAGLVACAQPPQRITGILRVPVFNDAGAPSGQIELPDARVFLQNATAQTEVATTKTQLDGKFELHARPGNYRLCWEREGLTGCGATLVVPAAPLALGFVRADAKGPLLYGRVLTGDGRPCWLNDPYFALEVATEVELLALDRSPVRKAVRANTQGEYLLPGLVDGGFLVHAACEKAEVEQQVAIRRGATEANLALPNRAPRITAMEGRAAGKGVTRVAPAAQIALAGPTRDPDLDAVEHRWRVDPGYGTLAGPPGPLQDWQLPSTAGLRSVYLLARDGRGGYAYERFDLETGDAELDFSGRVIDEVTKAPVKEARVEVGGTAVATNDRGWFALSVPPVAGDRYVLNIHHRNFALLSRVFDRSAAGNTYELIRTERRDKDPGAVIDVTDTESSGPCGSPGGKDPRRPLRLADLYKRQDPTHQTTPPPGQDPKPCRHRGARLILPAGSLETQDHQAPKAPVTVSFATLDPSRRALPGDYRALDPTLGEAELLSFGAVYAEFQDADGKDLDLKPGLSAEVRVPVSDLQRPTAKPTIDLWSYDEKTGYWRFEGKANLQNTPEGWMYIGQTTHFSEINMDVAGNDPDFATCVRLELDASLSAWQDLVLRAYVSYGGDSVQVKETALDGQQYHAIFRIPFGTGQPNSLRLELRGTFSGQTVVLLDDLINTDARPKMTGTDLWPDYPYTECGDPIVLTADPIALPYYGDIDATGRPAFLTGPYGQFLPVNGEQSATDYYTAIDPANAKTNLGDWWGENGFSDVDGTGGTRGSYLNHNDLGFGRDMNCRADFPDAGDLACFVTNYGFPDQNPANADDAASQNAATRGATVTMEYDASAAAAERVQFYVFGGGVAGSPRIKFADLDGLGPKPVPHLCLVCHGGSPTLVGNKAHNARFREFDLPSFRYPGAGVWDYGQAAPAGLDTAAFGTLNELVRDIAPNPSPIRSLITNWYPGNNFGILPIEPAVPAGWVGQEAGYQEVHGKTCRTCHVARDVGSITLEDSATFAITEYAVCDEPKFMPNAFITYKNFWSDPSRVLLYQALTGGVCP